MDLFKKKEREKKLLQPRWLVPLFFIVGIFVVVICFGVSEFMDLSSYESAQKLTLTHEVYIEKGLVPNPNIIVRTHDDSFVIAGDLNGMKQAWAVKTDADGNVKWRYTVPSVDKSVFGQGPVYYSAAVMPDDSVFFCGSSPRPPETPTPGLLTHLDKNGKVIKEQEIIPQNDSGRSINEVKGCAAHDDGLVLIGSSHQAFKNINPTEKNPAPYIGIENYWIVALDGKGKVKWEKLIPINEKAGTMPLTWMQTKTGDLYFAGVWNTIGTEVVHMTAVGDVVAKKVIPESALIVQPTNQDETLQLVSVNTRPLILITFNESLRETGRVTEKFDLNTVSQAYRSPNKSLMLFGSKSDKHGLFAQVIKVGSNLQHEQALVLAPNEVSYAATAAVPVNGDNQFACVRPASKPFKIGVPMTAEASRLGVAIDFIDSK